MDHPTTLAEALARRAAATPHDPWLFEPQGWDWRWRPFAAASAAVERAARRLAEAFPPGTRLALADEPTPETVVLDLAIQEAGLVSVPLSPNLPAALVTIEGQPDPLPGSPLRRLAVPVTWEGEPGGRGRRAQAPERSPSTSHAEHAATRDFEEPPRDAPARRASGGALVEATAAAALADRLGPSPGPQRDVVVLAGPFHSKAERRLLAWATWTGAAVLLVPPADRVANAAWARPTVFLGSPEEIAALVHAAGPGTRRRRERPPFGRLRAVVVTGPPPAAAAALLAERGVAVLGPEALG